MGIGKEIRISDNGEKLLLLKNGDFLLEPSYFNQGFCESDEIKLRESVVRRLEKARELLPDGYDFKIFDGYRLLDTQEKLFSRLYNHYREHNPDWDEQVLNEATENFVATPRYELGHPSPHNTGGAVDLTVVDERGRDLDMGVAFDEFTEESFTNHFEYRNKEVHENRMLLKCVMEEAGFINFENEWWHFSYGDQMWAFKKARNYAIYGSVELT
jgi:zinc D-Ala-D-Ala dipeptidase